MWRYGMPSRGSNARAASRSAALEDPSLYRADPVAAWRRFRLRGKADSRFLAVLRSLAAWRETAAQQRDLPRGRVLRDEALIEIASHSRTAYMCAERIYFKCHRMMVSDWLVAHGHEVLHIDNEKPAKPHKLMSEARVVDGRLIYRGDRLL